jgi:hypothetical protein
MSANWKISKVECPECGDSVEVSIEAGTALGTVSTCDCENGHRFEVRFLDTRCEVVREETAE